MSLKLRITVDDKIGLYNAFIKSLSPKFNVTDGERRVLSMLMFYNDKHRDLDENSRGVLMFSKQFKEKIAEELGISKFVLENRLSSLRKKGVIKGKKLTSVLGLYFR